MRYILTTSLITFSFLANAAIFAEPVFEIKPSEISEVSIKTYELINQARTVKIIAKNNYQNQCELGDRKLKKVTISEGSRNYDIYTYKLNQVACHPKTDSQTKTYLIDSFTLNPNEEIPEIIINGKIIRGGFYERE